METTPPPTKKENTCEVKHSSWNMTVPKEEKKKHTLWIIVQTLP